MKRGFTLAEIIIVLAVIGVLSAILIPVAFQAAPDEDVLRFKKAYNTFGAIIRELASSDAYYLDGDLGVRKNGKPANEGEGGAVDTTYLCESIADLLSIKGKDCSVTTAGGVGYVLTYGAGAGGGAAADRTLTAKEEMDEMCDAAEGGTQITTADGVTWFEANSSVTFADLDGGKRIFAGPNPEEVLHKDGSGFDAAYKVYCFDVDGANPVPEEGTTLTEDQLTTPPFGIGIRADGRIMSGKRIDDWALKDVQKGRD